MNVGSEVPSDTVPLLALPRMSPAEPQQRPLEPYSGIIRAVLPSTRPRGAGRPEVRDNGRTSSQVDPSARSQGADV